MPARVPNHAGMHLLASRTTARRLVAAAGLHAGSLVVDLGAGTGAVTAPLAATGARVLAVERDPRLVRALSARFSGCDRVRIVCADARTAALPHRPYRVVANIPFGISTALLERLLAPEPSRLLGADLIVEWGMARRLTRPAPRDLRMAWWAARYDLRLIRTIPTRCFRPPPSVNAAHLQVRPRSPLGRPGTAWLRAALHAGYAEPERSVGAVLRGSVTATGLRAAGLTARTPAGSVAAVQWYRLARRMHEPS